MIMFWCFTELGLVMTAMSTSIARNIIPCPTHLCVCSKKARRAECSNQKLPFEIPKLPSYVENVEFNFDHFATVSKRTFESISQNNISSIVMLNSQIQYIDPDTFDNLNYLDTLAFSNNENINITSLKLSLFSLQNRNLNSLSFDEMGWKDMSMKIFSGIRRKIYKVSLNFNSLVQLPDGMFDGLKQLSKLYAMKNKLSSCAKSLQELESLITLDLSYNKIEKCITNALPKTLQELNLESNTMKTVPNFCPPHGISHTPDLQTLDLEYNIISYISNNTVYCLTSLSLLDLQNNNVQYVSTIGLPQSLKELLLSSNHLIDVPDFCSSNGTLPSLHNLDFEDNSIYGITQRSLHCLPSLRTLNLGRNPFEKIPSEIISDIIGLQNLLLSEMKQPEIITEVVVFDIPSLKRFIFSGNRFLIPILNNCSKLETIDLSYNDFSGMTTFVAQELFRGLLKLQYIFLNSCNLHMIPNGFLKWFPNITHVSFANNYITNVQSDLFSEHLKMKVMSLASNRITHIGQKTFPSVFWQNVQHLDLSGNPFSCDCNLLWFRDKFKASPEIFLGDDDIFKKYECASPPERSGLQLRDFNLTQGECKAKSELFAIILSTGSICIVVFVSLLILYKGRWHIRYWIYMCRYKRSEYHRLINVDVRFDAFVIYSDEDSNFVHHTLLPKLEDEEDCRLCVHFRDFQPGKIIADNIVESMNESRMAIVVLSKHFCKSKWCKFELVIAQDRWLNNGSDALLLVMLEDLESDHMTPDLRALIRTTTYIMWTEDNLGQRLFWDQILKTLRRN